MIGKNKLTVFSGIQPSGDLHIGNYLGAIAQFVELQNKYDCIFCVVDYHAITVKQDPKILSKKIIEVAKIYLASGIDPDRSVIFQQSDISEHTELAWILNTIARMSDLFRMTQFKDKTGLKTDFKGFKTITYDAKGKSNEDYFKEFDRKDKNSSKLETGMAITRETLSNAMKQLFKVGVGLFDYPVLMTSDILLYNTDAVPVGEDQSQHVELARDLAKRFNHQFGEIFKVPKLIIKKEAARIMGLDNPKKKMSKSATSENNYIALTDEPGKAAKKIMRATTDSGSEIKFDPKNKPGISNLLTIYSLLSDKKINELEKKYVGKGYGKFKKDLAEAVGEFLNNFQKKYNKISGKEIKEILKKGAVAAKPIAQETMRKVKKKIGVEI